MNPEIELYEDESLESFLLRLSLYQGYERYSHFAEDIWHQTLDQHEAMAGAFPLELNRVNLYHAQTTSQMRVRVLIHLEKQLKLNNFGVLRLPLAHSKSQFSPNYKALNRSGVDYPHAFIRQRFTPICPQCLDEKPYIRQQWHFIPHQACHIHGCRLIHHCPECASRLEYQTTESIEHCECGYRLTESVANSASEAERLTARWLMGEKFEHRGVMAQDMTRSARYGFLLWYVNRYGESENISFDAFVESCASWPEVFHRDLDCIAEHGDVVRLKTWRRTFFNEAFGSLLNDCRYLPSRQLDKNIVLRAALSFFTKLVANNPSNVKGNIGDILLSPLEVSTLLSCTTDEVYRLYEFGEIKAAIHPRMHTKIASHQSAFTLRSIIEIKLTRMSSESDGLSIYLPEW
ncbi:TniQ family protein [Photobacterium kasasachensis]|uniref:TniQ family protein n=1 Tax=Photobacterium kasasachensis TaxID=2910240 RepID=UPI003D0B63E1